MPIETVGGNTTDDWAGVEDSYMDLNNPNDNPDTAGVLRVAWAGATLRYTTGIRFTGLSNISSSAAVSSAIMYVKPNNTGDALTYAARRMLRAWVENQMTWNIWSTGNSWTTAGGLSDGNDRTGTPEGTDTLTGGVQQYEGLSMDTAGQNWIDGTWTNNGAHLQSTAGSATDPFRHLISTQGADGSRPYFEVDFTISSGNDATMSDGFEFSDLSSMSASVNMSMSDGYQFSDSVSEAATTLMGMSDGYEFSDTNQSVGAFLMSLADSYIFSDSVSMISGLVTMTLNDGYTFADAISAVSAAVMSLDDAFILSDSASLNTGELVEGPITISVQVKQAVFAITIKKPSFETSVKQPKFDIEIN